MSPQSARYPTSAAGDAVASGGRHRRPESLADSRRSSDSSAMARIAGARSSSGAGAADIRPAAGSRADDPRTVAGRLRDQSGRLSEQQARYTRAARHAALPKRPPVTGSHRAPGTLPIEAWLLVGKTRQQVLLASLVAAGLLLVALPIGQRSQNVDAVRAAAERAAATSSAVPKKPGKSPVTGKTAGHKSDVDQKPDASKPSASSSAPADIPAITPSAAASPTQADLTVGPGNALRITGSAAVALTFDDGPDPVQTPRLLALLAKYDVKATFCLVGVQVRRHPELVRKIVDGGHTLCNHTFDHSFTIGTETPDKIKADLDRTSAAIRKAVPGVEIPFFRAPGGNFTDRLVTVAAESGMTSLYWEVDPRDWDHPDGETAAQHVARIVGQIRREVRPGSIVLSHDFNQPDTIEAYGRLLPWLHDHFPLGIPATAPAPATTPPSDPPPSATPSTPAPTPSAEPEQAAPE